MGVGLVSKPTVGSLSKRTCPKCLGTKDFYAKTCRKCQDKPRGWLGIKGEQHPTWKGGFLIDADGYIKTYAPTHPFPRRGGYVYEHDRILELELGRRLDHRVESVHHQNHDKRDNRRENLLLISRGEHSRHHRNLDVHLRQRDALGRFAGKEVMPNV